MPNDDVLAYFKKVLASAANVQSRPSGGVYMMNNQRVMEFDLEAATAWVTTARVALESVFPAGHAVRQDWDRLTQGDFRPEDEFQFPRARAVFRVAVELVQENRIATILDGVRSETVSELLDQADALVAKGHVVAATVLAGGALEPHLRRLCERDGIEWKGTGSISAYDDAIAQARNAGKKAYTATDSKNVKAWGGARNDAAHDPTAFTRTPPEVRILIDGVRQFIARTP